MAPAVTRQGWLHGTQSQLEFLPERHTGDFIFAVLAEELGLVGILILLALYILLIMRGLWIAARAQTTFGRVMAGGLMLILFVYVFVNIGMVSGILPVVGFRSTGQLWRIGANCADGWVRDCNVNPHPQENVVEKRVRGAQCVSSGSGSASRQECSRHVRSDDVSNRR